MLAADNLRLKLTKPGMLENEGREGRREGRRGNWSERANIKFAPRGSRASGNCGPFGATDYASLGDIHSDSSKTAFHHTPLLKWVTAPSNLHHISGQKFDLDRRSRSLVMV